MTVFLIALAAYLGLGALATVAMVGKDRTPITPGTAVATVVVTSVWVTGLVVIAVTR